MNHALHAHDYLMLAMVAGGVFFFMWSMAKKSADRKSKIQIDDYFLDDKTQKLSWLKTTGSAGVGFAGIVLFHHEMSGAADTVTMYGVFMAAVVGPIITFLIKGNTP